MLRAHEIAKRAAVLFVIAFLAVQIALPVAAMFGPRPARFAWQMYSGSKTQATFSIVRDDGTHEAVVLTDYVGYPRLDIDLTEHLPAFICEVEPTARAVRLERAGGADTSELLCNQ